MKDQVILITGALSGIGRATALAAASEGYKVVVSGRNSQTGTALETELRGLGADAQFIKADVRNESEVQALIEGAVGRFGRIDVAVNNAGTEGNPAPIVDQTPQAYAATFETNVLGVLLCMKHELRVMQPQGSGSIVNISSTMGSRGAPNASLYVASKHAVEGLTKSGALEAAAFGCPRQRGGARTGRDRHARSLHRLTGPQGRIACLDPASPGGQARRTRRRDSVPGLGQSLIRHRPDHQRQRRQDRQLIST